MLQAVSALPELSAAMWAHAPQRACHSIEAWSRQGLLSGSAVATWALHAPGFQALQDELATLIVWEALTGAVQRAADAQQVGPQDVNIIKIVETMQELHLCVHWLLWH